MKYWNSLFGLFLWSIPTLALSEETIPFLTYHIAPPFIVDEDSRDGLTYDLAEILSEKSAGRYRFVVESLPRKRLNLQLENMEMLVIPWVNPKWFGDHEMKRYLWSDGYLSDNNALLSSSQNPIEYDGPKSLFGKSIATIRGAKLVGIDEFVESGAIRRDDAHDFLAAMRMVLLGRVDVSIIPYPFAKYYVARETFSGTFHFSVQPHGQYMRHFLVKGRSDVREYLQVMVPFLLNDPQWQGVMTSYGMN